MTPRQRRRIGVLVGIALLAPLFLLGGATTALGSSVDEKRAEAARVQAEVEAQAERIAALDRRLDGAQRKSDAAGAALQQARAELADADRRMAEATDRLATQAVEVYVDSSSVSVLEQVSSSDGTDLHIRNQYLKTTAAGHRQALEDLRATREDLTARRAQLELAQRSARSVAEELDEQRAALAGGESDQRANLARVNGELAQLLREDQARRAAASATQAAPERPQPARRAARAPAAPGPGAGHAAPGGIWACIRQLESSNNYRAPRGGAYQIREPTWRSLGQPGRAEDADPATQDAMAIKLQQRSGWGQWPVTARRCGAY